MNDNFIDLPQEIILLIAYHSEPEDIIKLCQSYANTDFICRDWIFWATLAERHFRLPRQLFYPEENSEKDTPVDRYFYVKDLLDDPKLYSKKFKHSIRDKDIEGIKILLPFVQVEPMHILMVINGGDLEIFNMLLNNIKLTSSESIIFLKKAIEFNNYEMFKILLENITEPISDEKYTQLLTLAALKGNKFIVRYLLDIPNVEYDTYGITSKSYYYNNDIINMMYNYRYKTTRFGSD